MEWLKKSQIHNNNGNNNIQITHNMVQFVKD